jgi:O-antigen ligase
MKNARTIIGGGLMALVVIMPFHAFLTVWLGSLTGHQATWQAWKEVLTVVLVICAIVMLVRSPKARQRLSNPLNILIIAFAAVAVVVTALTRPNSSGIAYGLKTDLEFLVLFLIAQLGASRRLKNNLVKIVLVTGTIVAVVGLALVTVLPHNSLSHFGYSAKTIAPFEIVDPAITAIRTPSTLGGPNQLGSFLILPLCLAVGLMVRRFRWWQPVVIALTLGGIWVSYSRIALIGAVVGAVVAVVVALPRRQALTAAIVAMILLIGAGIGIANSTHGSSKLQYYVLHQSDPNQNNAALGKQASTSAHLSAFNEGLKHLQASPLGSGLGSAGPASYHTKSPFIPESYYLQIGIETGVVGLILFLAIIVQLARQLWRTRQQSPAPGLIGALVGLSIVNLVLHGWADASTAFVFWIVAGVVIGVAHSDREEYV